MLMQAGYINLKTFTYYMHEIVVKHAAEDRFQSSSVIAVYSSLMVAIQALQAHFGSLQELLMGKVSKGAVMKQFPFQVFLSRQMEQVCSNICVEIAEV